VLASVLKKLQGEPAALLRSKPDSVTASDALPIRPKIENAQAFQRRFAFLPAKDIIQTSIGSRLA
jgi:hypothetical protein